MGPFFVFSESRTQKRERDEKREIYSEEREKSAKRNNPREKRKRGDRFAIKKYKIEGGV